MASPYLKASVMKCESVVGRGTLLQGRLIQEQMLPESAKMKSFNLALRMLGAMEGCEQKRHRI